MTASPISISSIAAAHTVASAIAGHGDDFILTRSGTRLTDTRVVRGGRDFTEMRFFTEEGDWASATVTVERPRNAYGESQGARVNFSSAASGNHDTVEYALATADLIAFAARVAAQLNDWNDRGELDYLSA
jgi:hypothetical protein